MTCLRQPSAAKPATRYRLTYLHLLAPLTPARLGLALSTLVLRARAILERLYALRQASKAHKVLPADAARASKDSARYKSLLKRRD